MSRLEDFREWYTALWAPWQTSCLPEDLALPEGRYLMFHAERMLRDASLSQGTNCEFGVFQILGADEARRAACIWSPVTRLITHEVSLAFMRVEEQRQQGEIVSGHNVARLVETLYGYFRSVGRTQSRDSLQAQVERYVVEHSLADADGISLTRLPVKVDVPLLDELRLIDQEMQDRFKDMHGRPASLHWLGLGLDENLDDHRYGHCTPLNCRTFAGTGGDGHHFSFLVIDGEINESSPIVATAPDSFGNPSAVIADSLHQFLRLGCINGYDALGWVFLHSDDDKLAKHFIAANDRSSDEFSHLTFERDMLAYLRQRLNLEPWTDWQASRAIQNKYQPLLRHPPDAIF
jgi:hypothetical protein